MAASPEPNRIFSPLAAVLAWVWPGAGHIALGHKKRGFLIMCGVLFLFLSGLLIGGLDCVDRKNDRLWFLAQGLCGPIAFAADFANQRYVQEEANIDWARDHQAIEDYKAQDPDLLAILRRVGIGHVNEMGTLFIALAGLMNLAVILDALYFEPKARPAHLRRAADA